MGVKKITFIRSARSQKFTLKRERLEKILINSCQQCGRNDLMEIDFEKSLQNFLKKNPESFLLNFNGQNIKENELKIETVIVGPEGGFTREELTLFDKEKIVSFNTDNVLKSETAAVAIGAKIIL